MTPMTDWQQCNESQAVSRYLQTEKPKKNLRDAPSSEALPVDDRGARLIILLLRDPHLLERAQGRQDRTSNPDRIFPLWGRHNFDLHCGWCESSELLRHTLSDPLEHCG